MRDTVYYIYLIDFILFINFISICASRFSFKVKINTQKPKLVRWKMRRCKFINAKLHQCISSNNLYPQEQQGTFLLYSAKPLVRCSSGCWEGANEIYLTIFVFQKAELWQTHDPMRQVKGVNGQMPVSHFQYQMHNRYSHTATDSLCLPPKNSVVESKVRVLQNSILTEAGFLQHNQWKRDC